MFVPVDQCGHLGAAVRTPGPSLSLRLGPLINSESVSGSYASEKTTRDYCLRCLLEGFSVHCGLRKDLTPCLTTIALETRLGRA